MLRSILGLTLTTLLCVNLSLAEEKSTPNTLIATGQPRWVSSNGNKSPTDAMVDIGSMGQTGDALEVVIRWPYMPASFGPEPVEKERIVCQADRAFSFMVEEGAISPEGRYVVKKTYNPESQREEVEQLASQLAQSGNGFSSYGSDPRSLACWASARKCAGEDFTWPPPPNRTPLEYTTEARKMNADYNKAFVPACNLK